MISNEIYSFELWDMSWSKCEGSLLLESIKTSQQLDLVFIIIYVITVTL